MDRNCVPDSNCYLDAHSQILRHLFFTTCPVCNFHSVPARERFHQVFGPQESAKLGVAPFSLSNNASQSNAKWNSNFLFTSEMQDLINAAKVKQGRRRRTIFTEEQLKVLEESFQLSKYANRKTRREISKIIGLDEQQIRIWFQNRRAKDMRA